MSAETEPIPTNEEGLYVGPDGKPLMDGKIERIPGINASEGDPRYVDQSSPTVESDPETARIMATAEKPTRDAAATYREGANMVAGHQLAMQDLGQRNQSLWSKEGREVRATKKALDQAFREKGREKDAEAVTYAEADVAGAIMAAPALTPEQNASNARTLREMSRVSDEDAKRAGDAARRVIGDRKLSKSTFDSNNADYYGV